MAPTAKPADPDYAQPYKPYLISQRYQRMVGKLGIRTSINKLRHYSATELIAAGVDVRTVAGRLGHGGGGTTTLKTYAAFVSEADQRAAQVLLGRMPAPPVTVEPTGEFSPVDQKPTEPKGPYDQIASDLRAAIRCGVLRPGDHLPAMKTLAATYQVASSTIHRAVAALKEDGLVTAARGRRATVAEPPAEGREEGFAS